MRLQVSKTKNAASFYVVKSIYNKGIRTSRIVEKLGTEESLRKKLDGRDPYEWAEKYVKELTRLEKEGKEPEVITKHSPSKQIDKDVKRSFNGGYLFLQQIYHELGLHKICNEISKKHKFTFDLDSILSRLLYGRIIFPASKLATNELAAQFIEPPNFELQHIYRALEIITTESDFIQASLYQNSLKISKRNTSILYYDCTNYFFEIEQEEGLKQYGKSKENRPSPIVQMGLFMDSDGIPLAFNITNGNTNEQITLKPLEEKILSDFQLSKFVVCTDAGLASNSNRKFNDKAGRAFITTQSIKKLKDNLKKWALDPKGWHLPETLEEYDLTKIHETKHKDKVFYKERWINENQLEQKLIVTYSIKYKEYQRTIRNGQIERAKKAVESGASKLKKRSPNDPKRFIAELHCTPEGELAEKHLYNIDYDMVAKEESFDGFYAVCTNLEDDASEITKINHRRWEIEECFRIMKSEFKARPVYLQRDDRIKAHFTTCFIALIIYRFLEKKLDGKFTCSEIISGLRNMNFYEIPGDGFIPTYTRTDFTDALHEAFGFRTDYEIVTKKQMKEIFKATKTK
ncbi:MAG: IS1634 family transposase [Anaerovorax sp.]